MRLQQGFLSSMSYGVSSSRCLVDDPSEVFQTRAHALFRRNRAAPELDVLLHHTPARVAVPGSATEEIQEIKTAFANLRKDFCFYGLIEIEVPPIALVQDGAVYILDVKVAEKTLVLVRLLAWISTTVVAVTCIQTQSNVRSSRSIEKLLDFLGRFYESSDVRVKYQIKAEIR